MKINEEIIREVILETVGNDGIEIALFLKDNPNASEFDISKKIKIPIDITRNILYRLYNENLVDFIRKKDKKKGWYIYYWSIKENRILYLVTDLKKKKIEKIKARIEREKGNDFFSCSNFCIRVDFEQATNFEFKCPECGELIHQEDNSEKIEELKEEIKKLEKEIKKEDKKKQKE